MIKVKEAIVVEGKYDKIRLASIVDTLILETHGFSIFKDRQLLDLIRIIARERGLVILTDSDTAGFVIRDFLSGAVPPEQIKHAYIPAIFGKERRKTSRSKEGLLGVEGVDNHLIVNALENAGATIGDGGNQSGKGRNPITKLDLYQAGLTGGQNSSLRRKQLLELLGLPSLLSTNRLIEVLNTIMSRSVFEQTVKDFGWID
jgi:ribonuclease M5